ncbi:MAG: hydroxyacylglutathione hydrolase C-terminal domain-containing protein [Celeribacter marinus]
MATNPFLRADLDSVKDALGMNGSSNVDVFTQIRARKDKF